MKLDFLVDDNPNCPLLRLYSFTAIEASQLLAEVAGLASGRSEQIEVHRLPYVESIDGCRLSLVLQSWDQAVTRVGPSEFTCGLAAQSWDNVAALISPFAEIVTGYQWLAGSPGEAGLLLSASGEW